VDRAPVIAGNRALVVDRGGAITAIDVRTGERVWRVETRDLSGLLPRPQVVGDDLVVVPSVDGTLRALHLKDGTPAWTAGDVPVEVAPASVGALIAVVTTHGELRAFEARTGAPRFDRRLPGPVKGGLLATANNLLVAVCTDGTAVAVRPHDGAEVWRRSFPRGIFSEPAAGDDVIAVATEDGTLAAFATATGNPLWQVEGLGPLAGGPRVAGGRVLIASEGAALAFDARSGRPAGKQTLATSHASATITAEEKLVCVPRADGIVEVLAADTLERRYALRHARPAVAPVAVAAAAGTRVAVAAFEDGTILGFVGLP
jgi:outer membrane protein assembly factor BamB